LTLVMQSLLNGVLMGFVYALIALGLSIVFGVMNLSNFAHGEFVMLAMYSTFWVSVLGGVDAVVTAVITFPLLFLFGALTYYAVLDRTLQGPFVTRLAVTVGLMTLFRAVAQLLWTPQARALPYSIIQGNLDIGGGLVIIQSRLISAAISMVAIFGVYLFLEKTWPGRAMRAASDDVEAASLMGVNYRRVYALAFGLGSAVTAIAGALLMTFQQVSPIVGLRFGLVSWTVMCLAGLGSIPSMLISGVLVGVTESVAMAFWDPKARSIVVYTIFILVLALKPRGLFGKK
jgi:branched-chain amino acid transport system permease protein